MTRQQDFDVRVSPVVRDELRKTARGRVRLHADFTTEMRRLSVNGTRSRSAKKLSGLDLWETRVADHRAFFCLVPGSRQIAVGALVRKGRRKLRMAKLRDIERRVHEWRNRLMEETDEVGGS